MKKIILTLLLMVSFLVMSSQIIKNDNEQTFVSLGMDGDSNGYAQGIDIGYIGETIYMGAGIGHSLKNDVNMYRFKVGVVYPSKKPIKEGRKHLVFTTPYVEYVILDGHDKNVFGTGLNIYYYYKNFPVGVFVGADTRQIYNVGIIIKYN